MSEMISKHTSKHSNNKKTRKEVTIMPTINNVNITFSNDMQKVTLSTDNAEITMNISTFTEIASEIDKNCYYRNDIINHINELINEGELPAEAASNEEFISSMLETYAELREDNEGDEYGMSWTECLIETFEDIDYEDFIEEDE